MHSLETIIARNRAAHDRATASGWERKSEPPFVRDERIRKENRRQAGIAAEIARLTAELEEVPGTDIAASNARQSLRLRIYDLRQEVR